MEGTEWNNFSFNDKFACLSDALDYNLSIVIYIANIGKRTYRVDNVYSLEICVKYYCFQAYAIQVMQNHMSRFSDLRTVCVPVIGPYFPISLFLEGHSDQDGIASAGK